jgi:hypothetical protein
MNNSKNKNIKWKWTNLKRILTLCVRIGGLFQNSEYSHKDSFFTVSIYLKLLALDVYDIEQIIWTYADRSLKNEKESQLPVCKLRFSGRSTRYFHWKLHIHHGHPQAKLDCYLSSTLWSNNLSLFHSPHINNPHYNTRMSALTVSVQSWNSKKHHSIKGYCSMLLTVSDPKYKLCYLQS